jgi:hypothetical protein
MRAFLFLAGYRNDTVFLEGDDLSAPRGREVRAVPGGGCREPGERPMAGGHGIADRSLTDPATGFHRRLDEVFHLD